MLRYAEHREPFQHAPIWPFSSSFRRTPPVHKARPRWLRYGDSRDARG
jgi:hypothetical protein